MLSVLLCLAISPAYASALVQKQIVGKVTDDQGQPLPGVSINIKGSTQGTSTDESGTYSISASPSSVLVFKFLGYSSIERTVGNASEVNVQMQQDVQSLEQIVVTGYATQRKKDLTGAVSVVDDGLKAVTRPAACEVAPAVRPAFSSRRTSPQPCSAR